MEQKIFDSLEKGQEYINSQRPRSILYITGKKSFSLSGAKNRLKPLIPENSYFFDELSSNPKIEEVVKGIEIFNKFSPDYLVAIGGGSVIDMAKLINGLADTGNAIQSVKDNKVTRKNQSYFVAVPTTSGSGSEATPYATVYIDKKKYSLSDRSLIPRVVVLDSSLTHSLSSEQTAITGMDALSQGIESYWSINSTSQSKWLAQKAISIIWDKLIDTVKRPNAQNRERMQLAANYAGMAIAISQTTACHSISYPITSRYGIPHGHAVSLTLGEMLKYNSEVDKSDCADKRGLDYVQKTIREIFGFLHADSASSADRKIKKLMQDVGLECRFFPSQHKRFWINCGGRI